MNNMEAYLSITVTILGLLVSAITFLLKFMKSAKGQKAAQTLVKVTSAIIPYIEEAETFLNYTGEEKKAYVTTKITQMLMKEKINVCQEKISDIIEDFISLTKKVNTGKSSSPKLLQKLTDNQSLNKG